MTWEGQSLPNEADVRAELHRILSSHHFRVTERLSAFLRHVVLSTLARDASALKEYAIGLTVFGRGVNFDPRVDPIVRVEAGRLRLKLEQFYKSSPAPSGFTIEVPKGGYSPRFLQQLASEPEGDLPMAATGTHSLAVMPVEVLGEAPGLDRFGRILTIEIRHALTQGGFFEVASSSEQGEPAARSPHDLVLATSVWPVREDALRIIVELSRASDRRCLWSHAFERNLGDLDELQQELPRSLCELLRQRHGAAADGPLRRKSTNLAAYNLYLKGRYYWNLRSEDGLKQAVRLFSEAISEDPRYALAYAGLADAYMLLANYGVTAPEDVRPKAKEYALRAVELDSLLPEARTSLAHVHSTYEWDWQSAELEYRAAIQLNPDYATAHHWYAITVLAPLGRLSEAFERMELARDRDPISVSVYRDLGLVHFYKRDYAAGLEQARRTQTLAPQFDGGFWLMGLISEQLGMTDAAIASFSKAVMLSGRHPRMLGALAHSLALSGDRDGALRSLEELKEMEKTRYISRFEMALIRMSLGDLEEAILWLQKAFEIRSYELVTLAVDPRYDPIRGTAEYNAIVRDMRLQG